MHTLVLYGALCCVCDSVCVRQEEREREKTKKGRKKEGERERELMSLYA